MVLEKTLESPLDSKEIKSVNPKENQPWLFVGRTDAEAEAQLPDSERRLIRKDPDSGEDWRQQEKWVTKDAVGMSLSELWERQSSRVAAVHKELDTI